jgi:hypothetical protein
MAIKNRQFGATGNKTQDKGKQRKKTQHRKLKRWATQTPPKTGGWNQVFVKGKKLEFRH